MYTLIRRIHLYAAMIIMLFVTMYFVTGLMMTHENWFGSAPATKTTQQVTLDYQGQPGTEAFAAYLQEKFDIGGRALAPRQDKSDWIFGFGHPGHYTEVRVTGTNAATITTTTKGWQRAITELHRLHGYHGGALYVAWGILYDLSCVALILFAASGIYLWWTLARRKWPGMLVLAGTYGLTVATTAYLVLRR